ncbi:MAG TPA: hypothetical protein VHY37_11895, partial [Tepidisphaeraceae bacterium]|nr:hypothetical protein [Tepidisphaeraceae bacterium]
ERIFRDSRINLIVEGANEVMQSFVFAYGGKQLAERMLGIQQAVGWDHHDSPTHNLARIFRSLKHPAVMRAAAPLGAELYLGLRPPTPEITGVRQSLRHHAQRLCELVREHSHRFKMASRHYGELIISRQLVQARLADSAMWLHAWACTVSRLDRDIRSGRNGTEFTRDKAAAEFFMAMAEHAIDECFRGLFENSDTTAVVAADAALAHSATLPNGKFAIPEASPIAKGTGRVPPREGIKQFPGRDGQFEVEEIGNREL